MKGRKCARQCRTTTFAEIVREVEAAPIRSPAPLRPGRVNKAGVLASPTGDAFTLEAESIEPAAARQLVGSGARVAQEACGCGGGYCMPTWVDASEGPKLALSEPRRIRGLAPSWIDYWVGPFGQVVFLHGDYRWD